MQTASEHIKQTIASLLSDRPTRQCTRHFVDLCYRIALVYLRQKRRGRHLAVDMLGLSLEDLAMDSIAELFERDTDGCFVQLVRYFESLRWQEINDEDLLQATRRLVFSKVNDHLFQGYGEADPSLSHLIRNLKRALKTATDVSLGRRGKALWIKVDTPSTP